MTEEYKGKFAKEVKVHGQIETLVNSGLVNLVPAFLPDLSSFLEEDLDEINAKLEKLLANEEEKDKAGLQTEFTSILESIRAKSSK